MRVVVARPLIRVAAERWKNQYFHGGKWGSNIDGSCEDIYERLKALNVETAKPEEVSAIIGNKAWSNYFCTECNDYFPRAIALEGGDGTSYICEGCLRHAIELIGPSAQQQKGDEHGG